MRNYNRTCEVCQRCKYDPSAYLGLMQPLPIHTAIWAEISMDFIEGLPMSAGKEAIMLVVDRLTKYTHFVDLKHPFTSVVIAESFHHNIFKLHGLPRVIVSDMDTIFLSKL